MSAQAKRRVIILGGGKRIGLGDYVRTLRRVFSADPSIQYPYSLRGWAPADGATIAREFLDGVHDRINQRLPGFGEGRAWRSDAQRAMLQDARKINRASGERLIVRASEITTRGWRERFSRVLTAGWE